MAKVWSFLTMAFSVGAGFVDLVKAHYVGIGLVAHYSIWLVLSITSAFDHPSFDSVMAGILAALSLGWVVAILYEHLFSEK